MSTLRYTHWQDGDVWLGYLEEFPDYWTQGYSLEELKANLLDLHRDLADGHILVASLPLAKPQRGGATKPWAPPRVACNDKSKPCKGEATGLTRPRSSFRSIASPRWGFRLFFTLSRGCARSLLAPGFVAPPLWGGCDVSH